LFGGVVGQSLDGILKFDSVDLQFDSIGAGSNGLGRGRSPAIPVPGGDLLGLGSLDKG
jgi:hypothetical protein